jgi:1,4-alpha-glucan branching enzyme
MVDGPSLHGDTALGRPVGDSEVVAFGRDLQVSYRVWSPKSGYPGHAAYRDFHTYDHRTGLKPARVTGRNVPSDAKAPYDPERADRAVDGHVADFVNVVRGRLEAESERIGRPAHVVAAFDTELFGHWCASARSATPSPRVSSAKLSNYRPALGVPARTGRCGPVTRWPTWCGSTPRSSTPR